MNMFALPELVIIIFSSRKLVMIVYFVFKEGAVGDPQFIEDPLLF